MIFVAFSAGRWPEKQKENMLEGGSQAAGDQLPPGNDSPLQATTQQQEQQEQEQEEEGASVSPQKEAHHGGVEIQPCSSEAVQNGKLR
jgi:hypothetical protein